MAIGSETLTFLESVFPFWKSLNSSQKKKIQETAILRHYPHGTMVRRGGEDCTGVMAVREGQFRVFLVSDSGKEVTLYRLLDRDICLFSASCVMKNISFDVFIEAEKDTEVVVIPAKVYQELEEESLSVTNYSNQLIQSRFSDVMWLVEQVMFMSFDKRLAIFLLEQSSIDGGNTLHITQEAVAKHMGSAREVVTRMLKYFQNEGLVRLFRGGIEIVNREDLEKLAQ